MSVISINTLEEFEKAIQDEQSFIKVSTTTCAPCKMMSPLFEKVSDESEEGSFYSVEVDTVTPELAKYAQDVLNISTVPGINNVNNGNPENVAITNPDVAFNDTVPANTENYQVDYPVELIFNDNIPLK